MAISGVTNLSSSQLKASVNVTGAVFQSTVDRDSLNEDQPKLGESKHVFFFGFPH